MPEPGDILDEKYRLLQQLGHGGMGAVYEATHEQIGKSVAVKVLLAKGEASPELIARFHQEAQAASAAGHRGIIDIYDVGLCPDGSPYLVMELLQGQSLAELLKSSNKLEASQTAFIVCQVLSALSAAHDAGIVHRDLKPENIYLAETGAPLPEVKLLDFGISRIVVPGDEAHTRMTRTGAVMGTPLYMSPEQAAGKKDIDFRTDLYSIAVILFQCLTGNLPHHGDNYNALMASIISDPPSLPLSFLPDLSPDLNALILKNLEKRPTNRSQSASEMFFELKPFVDQNAHIALRAPSTAPAGQVPVPTLREQNDTEAMGEAQTELAPTSSDSKPTTADPLGSKRQSKDRDHEIPATQFVEPGVEADKKRSKKLPLIVFAVIALVIGGAVGTWAMIFFGGDSVTTTETQVRIGADPAPLKTKTPESSKAQIVPSQPVQKIPVQLGNSSTQPQKVPFAGVERSAPPDAGLAEKSPPVVNVQKKASRGKIPRTSKKSQGPSTHSKAKHIKRSGYGKMLIDQGRPRDYGKRLE